MIAITGAAGFIGSNLVHRLSAAGHQVCLVDHPFTAAKARNWVGLPSFHYLTDALFLDALKAGSLPIEVIFHLGACSSTTETDWEYLLRNNIGYTQSLWNWCAEAKKPFYYASSAATYGDGAKGFDDRTSPSELQPLNLYGKSKNDFDLWALGQVSEGKAMPPSWAGLKFFNVYGPREIHKGRMSSVVWHARRQILQTGEVQLFRSDDPRFTDGGQRRDFVFVGDCLDHLIWLWQNPGVCGIFNSGTGEARTFDDLAKAVFDAMGRERRIRYVEMPSELRGRYQSFTQADMTKLRSAGFPKPATTLEAGVKAALDGVGDED